MEGRQPGGGPRLPLGRPAAGPDSLPAGQRGVWAPPPAADLPKLKHLGGSFYFDFCLPCQPNLILYLGILSRNMSDTSDPGDLGSIHEHGCSDSPLAGQGMYPLLILPPLAGQPESKCISNLSAPGKLKNQKPHICQPCQPLGG